MNFLRLNLAAWISIASLALVLAGCGDDDVMIGEDDAGGGGGDAGTGDDGGPPPSDGGGPILCGASTCADGEFCCNESCGICAPLGGTCTEMACSDAGPPPTDGGTGEECGPVTCAVGQVCCNASCGICTGPDESCITLACEDAGPPGMTCGGFLGTPCPDGTFCNYPPEAICGAADGTGVCEPIGGPACPRIYAPVCGCDGVTYDNDCEARAAGMSIASVGECGGGGELCDAQDAYGEGMCDAWFGYHWNGSSCYGVSGCSCVGADCDTRWDSIEACEAAHDECDGTISACGTPGGVSCGPMELCDYPDEDCGSAGVGGTCTMRPDACIGLFDPVCGCDGVTYSNDCAAHSVGIDVDYRGECGATAEDCRTTGCGPDGECQYCFRGWSCVPRGAMC